MRLPAPARIHGCKRQEIQRAVQERRHKGDYTEMNQLLNVQNITLKRRCPMRLIVVKGQTIILEVLTAVVLALDVIGNRWR